MARGRPKKMAGEQSPVVQEYIGYIDEKKLTAKSKVSVRNISGKRIQFAFGFINPGEIGFSEYSELTTYPTMLERADE